MSFLLDRGGVHVIFQEEHPGEVRYSMLTKDFDYTLPEELIAQEPLEDRTASRMLVLNRDSGNAEHRMFREVGVYLDPGDVLVVNDTRVSAFRLQGKRNTGAAVEALITRRVSDSVFHALMKPGRRLKAGDKVSFGDHLKCVILEELSDGSRNIELTTNQRGRSVDEAIAEVAKTPLPPYIKVPLPVGERYQTVYSAREGSTAAPTAGLHFTRELLGLLQDRGVVVVTITLHIGASTFRPVRSETLDNHVLDPERICISREAADVINAAKGRIVAVGTTSTRALEAAAVSQRKIAPFDGETDLFIKPGYKFRIVTGMITNFHMPRSTLFVLVSAFAGREKLLSAYEQAVINRYRFLSLGDAMLII